VTHFFPLSEYWYLVMRVPPSLTGLRRVIARALFVLDETRIVGRPGTVILLDEALEDWVVAVLLAPV
jgi:hypothetical protein